jgi:hypothetical protein
LTPLGNVEKSLEVLGEARLVDIWFVPFSEPATDADTLGLLGKLVATPCLLEPFRNQPTLTEVRNCLLKLFLVQADFQRRARRGDVSETYPQEGRIPEAELPQLWILASSASDTLLTSFGANSRTDWEQGVFFLAESFRTAIIAINRLPQTPDTLWLRLLGREVIQRQAIREVLALPLDHPQRETALRLLANWRINIEASGEIDEDDRELIMALSQAYLEWEQETRNQGVQEGIQQGQRLVIENLLRVRFGNVDESLATIIPTLLELPVEEYTGLLLQLSREELLARFQSPAS